jgi:hypothetical protein
MTSSREEVPTEQEVRERRVMTARANRFWSEVEETALVRRERWLIHAETDEMFSPFAAQVWANGSANIAQNDRVPLTFYVDREGEVRFLERQPGTWSQVVARRARRRSGAAA